MFTSVSVKPREISILAWEHSKNSQLHVRFSFQSRRYETLEKSHRNVSIFYVRGRRIFMLSK